MKFFSLLLFLVSVISGHASEVSSYGIQKIELYNQASAAAPNISTDQPYQVTLSFNPSSIQDLLESSTFTPPGGNPTQFLTYPSTLAYVESFKSKAALDATFPAGTYNFTINTTTPNTYTGQLALGADAYPSVVPQIVNLTNAVWQNGYLYVPDVTKQVVIQWNTYNNPSSGLVYLTLGNTGIPPSYAVANNIVTYTFAAGALVNNETFAAQLSFYNVVPSGTSFISGATTFTYYATRLCFNIKTAGATTLPNYYAVNKQSVTLQTSNAVPTGFPATTPIGDYGPYRFITSEPTTGSVVGPGAGSPYAINPTASSPATTYSFNSGPLAARTGAGSLDSIYPDGTYTFRDSNNNNLLSLALSGDVYPDLPMVTAVNGAAPVWNAQGQLVLYPFQANTITWSPFTASNANFNFANGGEEIFTFTNNSDINLLQGAGSIVQGAAASFNSYTIPANTLTFGFTYLSSIQYTLAAAAGSIAGTTATTSYGTDNEFIAIGGFTFGVSQAITFPAIANQGAGTSFQLNATSTSGLPVSYTLVSGPATLSGTNNATCTVTGGGTVVIMASQVDPTGTYANAPTVQQSFTALPAQTITNFPAIANQVLGASPIVLNAACTSGLAVTYSVTGAATLTGANHNTLTFNNGTGSVTVTASAPGNSTYAPTTASQTFLVTGSGVLTITAKSQTKYFGNTFDFTDTAYTVTGLQNGDTIGSITMACTGAAAVATTGNYAITPSAATGGTFNPNNYAITYVPATMTVVNPPTPIPFTGVVLPNPADSVSNLLKYVFHIDPSQTMSAADRAALPALHTETIGATTYLMYSYRQSATLTGVTVTPQVSTNLSNWMSASSAQVDTDPVTNDPIMNVRVPVSGSTVFVRLTVSGP